MQGISTQKPILSVFSEFVKYFNSSDECSKASAKIGKTHRNVNKRISTPYVITSSRLEKEGKTEENGVCGKYVCAKSYSLFLTGLATVLSAELLEHVTPRYR